MALQGSNVGTFVSSGTSCTVTVPTNSVGSIIVLRAKFDTGTRTATFPAGFTALTATASITRGILYWAWKRVSGSADTGSYTVTSSGSTNQQLLVSSWSGRIATGTPFTFTTQNDVATASSAPTLTGTAAAGDDLDYGLYEFAGQSGLTVTGFTIAQDDVTDGVHLWKNENVAGGSVSVTTSTGSSTSYWPSLASIIAAPAGSSIPDLVMAPMRGRL